MLKRGTIEVGFNRKGGDSLPADHTCRKVSGGHSEKAVPQVALGEGFELPQHRAIN